MNSIKHIDISFISENTNNTNNDIHGININDSNLSNWSTIYFYKIYDIDKMYKDRPDVLQHIYTCLLHQLIAQDFIGTFDNKPLQFFDKIIENSVIIFETYNTVYDYYEINNKYREKTYRRIIFEHQSDFYCVYQGIMKIFENNQTPKYKLKTKYKIYSKNEFNDCLEKNKIFIYFQNYINKIQNNINKLHILI